MQIFAPQISSGEARENKEGAYSPLYAPTNKAALDQIGKDAKGKMTFGGQYLGTDAICVNIVGTLDAATTARVVLPYPVGIPAGWANSVGRAALRPSAPKAVAISVEGLQVGTATIATDGSVTFSALEAGIDVAANKEIALNFDSLVNSGGGDITLSLYVLK